MLQAFRFFSVSNSIRSTEKNIEREREREKFELSQEEDFIQLKRTVKASNNVFSQ